MTDQPQAPLTKEEIDRRFGSELNLMEVGIIHPTVLQYINDLRRSHESLITQRDTLRAGREEAEKRLEVANNMFDMESAGWKNVAEQARSTGFEECREQAAKLCEEAERRDEIDYGAASSGAAHGLAERIRALQPISEKVTEDAQEGETNGKA